MEDKLDGVAPNDAGKPDADDSLIARVRRIYRQSRAVDVPEQVHESQVAAFRAHRANPSRTVYVARLLFDSWTNLAPAEGLRTAALRAGDVVTARHQIYSTAWHDVDLYGERQSGDFWYLIGQILPKSAEVSSSPRRAVLVGDGKSFSVRPENGEFHIGSVRSGTYELRLELDRAEVLVPNVQVGL